GRTSYALTVNGDDALDDCDQLREMAPRTGFYPVLLGALGEEDLPTRRTVITHEGARPETYPTTSEILKEAESIDFLAWLKERAQMQADGAQKGRYSCKPGDEEAIAFYRAKLEQPDEFKGLTRGDWPDEDEVEPFFRERDSIATHVRLDSSWIGKPVTLAL